MFNITEIFGDNPVLIPDPVYPVYFDSNVMSGRDVTFIRADEKNGFLLMESRENRSVHVLLGHVNVSLGRLYRPKD